MQRGPRGGERQPRATRSVVCSGGAWGLRALSAARVPACHVCWRSTHKGCSPWQLKRNTFLKSSARLTREWIALRPREERSARRSDLQTCGGGLLTCPRRRCRVVASQRAVPAFIIFIIAEHETPHLVENFMGDIHANGSLEPQAGDYRSI